MSIELEKKVIQLLCDSYPEESGSRARRVAAIVVTEEGECFTGFRGEVRQLLGNKEVILHAERVALNKAGDKSRGATLYTTLEPCVRISNNQQTDSCSELIIQRGIAKVVFGIFDENQLIETRGWQVIRDKNIQVEFFSKENREYLETNTVDDQYYNFPGENGTRWRYVRDDTQLSIVLSYKTDNPLKIRWSISGPSQMQIIHGTDNMVSHAMDGQRFNDEIKPSMLRYRSHFCRLVSGQFVAIKLSDSECFLIMLREKRDNDIQFRWRYICEN